MLLVSVEVFALPFFAAGAFLVAVEASPDPRGDALRGIVLGFLPGLALAALQFLVVFARLLSSCRLLIALSGLLGACWLAMFTWRFGMGFQAQEDIGTLLGAAYAFLAFAAVAAGANAVILWRRRPTAA